MLGNTFLDDFNNAGKEAVLRLLASDILGSEQYELLVRRYDDMSRNFDCVTADGKKKKRYKNDSSAQVWTFSQGVMPHCHKDGPSYSDTSNVRIPITHNCFSQLRDKAIALINDNKPEDERCGAVIGLDLPAWFNMRSDKRIMIVAQDLLRDPRWYFNCKDAICSTPFGLHGREWREDGRGGRRMAFLVEKLIKLGYGVYLTDAYKYFLKGWKDNKAIGFTLTNDSDIISRYGNILKREVAIIQPEKIVTLGRAAHKALDMVIGNIDCDVLNLTHFSGSAQGTFLKSAQYAEIKEQNGWTDNSVEIQAAIYAKAIELGIKI